MSTTDVSGYQFNPAQLDPMGRKPGISAFLRTRNGADFVEPTIRSHIDHFDEIVAVYNQCEDATGDILARLAQEFGPRLRVFHYLDPVHPLGSTAHAKTPGSDPRSMVAYSNFALAQTRHLLVTKLDDDHLAIPAPLEAVIKALRKNGAQNALHSFSGLNLAHAPDGTLALPAFDPVSGGGDIGFFPVSPKTHFGHDRRFERFQRGSLGRVFVGFLYWHLKYLKTGAGFKNYDLAQNPTSRFAKKQRAFSATPFLSLPQARTALSPSPKDRLLALLSAKKHLGFVRDAAISSTFPHDTLEAALDDLSPSWRQILDSK